MPAYKFSVGSKAKIKRAKFKVELIKVATKTLAGEPVWEVMTELYDHDWYAMIRESELTAIEVEK